MNKFTFLLWTMFLQIECVGFVRLKNLSLSYTIRTTLVFNDILKLSLTVNNIIFYSRPIFLENNRGECDSGLEL